LHTEAIGKLGFLEKIFNTPSAHRVHHATNEEYMDKNFGGYSLFGIGFLARTKKKKQNLRME
jgi:sterol desaturase/sphingolipid hydroxylase (fatty acid hydroxylase superfamily)